MIQLGHTTLTKEEIVKTVTLPDCADNEEDDGITDTPPVPSHSKAFATLSINLCWLEAQDHCDPASFQLVRRLQLQQNVAIKQSTKLTQRRVQ